MHWMISTLLFYGLVEVIRFLMISQAEPPLCELCFGCASNLTQMREILEKDPGFFYVVEV